MLCHSHKNTIRLIDDCADDYDDNIVNCCDNFVGVLKVQYMQVIVGTCM